MLWRSLVFLLPFTAIASSILNTPVVDSSQFRVTQFATNLPLPSSLMQAKDGSLLALISPGYGTSQVVRFTDLNNDGIADGAPTVLYSNAGGGPALQLRQGENHYYIAEFGSKAITVLAPGASPGDPLSAVGSLQFQYPSGHGHPTPGIAVRPTPGTPGSVDLVFNIGAEFNDQASVSPVIVSGLGLDPIELDGDSIYMITINESGTVPVASNLRQVATGIRNVYGMAFHPTTGDLYFADNAIDENNPTNFTEPPQADELNRIVLSQLGVEVLNFGYPNCYPAYRSGSLVETLPNACDGVTQSLMNFQPVPTGAVPGARSEGPTEIAFAPALFPALFQDGIFVGFSGGTGPGGTNDQNPVVFVPAGFLDHFHFVSPGVLGRALGVYSTQDSLFLADWSGGTIYQIQAISEIPEPPSSGSVFFTLILLGGVVLGKVRPSALF